MLGHRLGHEDRQVGVSGKVARATDAVHHVRAVDVRGVDVAVDVALERRVDGDQAQAADDLGVVGHLLRTQHQTRLVVLDVAQHALVGGLGEGDGRGGGEAQATAVQQLDGTVLQHLGVHLEVVEGRVDQAGQHRVGDGADARLQGLQRGRQAAHLDLVAQELVQVAGDGIGFCIGRQDVGGAVVLFRDDDGRDLGRVNGDEGHADALFRIDQRDGLAVRAVGGNEDVVQAFELNGHLQVDLDDHLLGQDGEAGRVAHRGRRHDGTGFGDGRGLDHGNVDRGQLARAQLLDGFGQVLVEEHHLAVVDLLAQGGVHLEGQTARDRVGFGQDLVGVVAQRGAGHQGNLEVFLAGAVGQRQRHGLAVTGAGETAHAHGHAVFKQGGRVVRGHDLVAQAGQTDAVFVHGVSSGGVRTDTLPARNVEISIKTDIYACCD